MILLDTGMRKMPDKCSECNFFRVESQMYCTAVVGYTTVSKPYERRPVWCPLHEDTDTDTISRKQAIDALFEILDRPKHAEFLYTDEIYRVLSNLPPSPSRPKGQWMPETMSEIVECDLGDNDSVVGHYCSVCNKDAYTNNCGDELLTDFCPNCGADMRP